MAFSEFLSILKIKPLPKVFNVLKKEAKNWEIQHDNLRKAKFCPSIFHSSMMIIKNLGWSLWDLVLLSFISILLSFPVFSKLWNKLRRLWWQIIAQKVTELFKPFPSQRLFHEKLVPFPKNLCSRSNFWYIYIVLFVCIDILFSPTLTSSRSFISTVYFLILCNQLIQFQTLLYIFLYFLWNEEAELKPHVSFTRNKVIFTLLPFWIHLFLLKSI